MTTTTMQTVEEAETVEVGRYYSVNVIRTDERTVPWCGNEMPMLGDFHEDKEIINFPFEHVHVDWRFVSHALFYHLEQVIATHYSSKEIYKNAFLGLPVTRMVAEGKPFRKPLVCVRPQLMWDDDVVWMARLERAYLDKRAIMAGEPYNPIAFTEADGRSLTEPVPPGRTCRTCPHRGISLVGAPVDERGTVVCPGHGLAWDQSTGILRPRGMILEELKRQFVGRGVKQFMEARREAKV